MAENGSLVKCSQWAYDTTYFTETLSMKYDIVCDNAYLGTLSGTLRMFGLLIGSLVFGWLSDIIGRVPTITLAGLCLFAAQVVAVFSVNYFMFSLCNMFIAAGGVGSYIVGFVILFEWLSPDWRSFGSIYSQIPFGIGFLYTIFLGYVTTDWVTMQWVMAGPNIIFLLLFFLVPESPRWLVSVGKVERARKAIGVAAKSNGLPVPDYIPVDEANKAESVAETGIIGLLSHRSLLCRLVVMSLEWIGQISPLLRTSDLTSLSHFSYHALLLRPQLQLRQAGAVRGDRPDGGGGVPGLRHHPLHHRRCRPPSRPRLLSDPGRRLLCRGRLCPGAALLGEAGPGPGREDGRQCGLRGRLPLHRSVRVEPLYWWTH